MTPKQKNAQMKILRRLLDIGPSNQELDSHYQFGDVCGQIAMARNLQNDIWRDQITDLIRELEESK